jgi:porin
MSPRMRIFAPIPRSLLSLALLALPAAAQAQSQDNDEIPAHDQRELPNQKIGPRVWNVEPAVAPRDFRGPLAAQGAWLADHGIRPHLNLTHIYLGNPSVGLQTGKREALTLFAVGADLDMDRLLGWHGGAVHMEELFVPYTHNLSYGLQAGDALVGKPGPYIPKVNHLTLFTYEQKFLGERLTMEAGKSNAGNYFALPLCNVPITCVNTILQDSAGFNPPPYSNWSLRSAWDFSPRLRAQLGAWRSNDAYPFTNGWERHAGDSGGSLSTLYVANLAYRTDYTMQAYPQSWEALVFHRNQAQRDPYYTVLGTSRLSDTDSAARSHDGVEGYYLGGRKTVWRADAGNVQTPFPKALSAFASFTHVAQPGNSNGVASQGNAGLILSAPWQRRPLDSYSLNLRWVALTRDQQRLLEEAYTASGGQGEYRPGRESVGVSVDGNVVLSPAFIVSGSVGRIWNASSWLNPYTAQQPRDGYAFSVILHVNLDQVLGLASRP